MALTSGFFNSLNRDRRYNAEQLAAIFDNILTDGIIASQGDHFAVTTANNGMQIMIGTGRAWFDHTWSKNDSIMVLTVSDSDATRQRRDIVVLEVNHENSIRKNSIKIVQGSPTANGTLPTLVNTTTIKQYPLAYITVPARATTISASNIENRIGLGSTPFSTGILQSTPLDSLWAQWKSQFEDWFEGIKLILSDDVIANLTAQLANKVNISDKATTSEATAGTNNTHWMTPALVKAAIDPIRNTVYVQNLNRRVYVNAMLTQIVASSYKINYPSSATGTHASAVITSNTIYFYQTRDVAQGSSSLSPRDVTAYSYKTTRPVTSNRTLTAINNIAICTYTSNSYDTTEHGTAGLNMTGTKPFNVMVGNMHGYNPSTSPKTYWRVLYNLNTEKMFTVGQSSSNESNAYCFVTDSYEGVIYRSNNNSNTSYKTLYVRYHSSSGTATYTEKTVTLGVSDKFMHCIGGYGNTLFYVLITHPNTTDITLEVHSITINASSVSTVDSIANINIKGTTRWQLLYYDDTNAYIMVGKYSIPLIFSFANKRFTNAEVVAASSTSSAFGLSKDNDIHYYGVQDNLHYFQNKTTGTVFTLARNPTTTTAYVIRSNIILAYNSEYPNTYLKPYNNAWRPQHFVVYGEKPVILDWQGHTFTPPVEYSYSYLMPDAISTDTMFGLSGYSGVGFTPLGPDAEFTLVTDGKAAS